MKFKVILKFLTLMLAMQVVVSCNSEVEDVNKKSGKSTFEFSKIEPVSSETIATNTNWPDIKNEVTVDLKTCFVDTTYLQDIVGEDFEISSDFDTHQKTTNANGCLSWTETFEFDFFSNETYYRVSGSIKGDGNYKGSRRYQLAINPWTGKVVDLDYGSVYKIQSASLSDIKSQKQYNALVAKKYTVHMLEKNFFQDKTHLKMEVVTEPEFVRAALNGGVTASEKFTGGEFRTQFYLISKNLNSNERKILDKYETIVEVARDGKLKSEIEFTLNQGIDPNSKVELGIDLFALNDDVDMGNYSGTVAIKQLHGSFSEELANKNISFQRVERRQKSNTRPLNQSIQEFGFVIDSIKIENGSEGEANLRSGSSERRVDAKFTIKMVDSLIREDIKKHPFQVEIVDLDKNIVLDSNVRSSMTSSGYIKFRTSIPFKSYDKRAWKQFMVKISGVNDPYREIYKERLVHINPWIKTSDFGIDSKFGDPPQITAENIPEIFIQDFNYAFIDNRKDSFKLNKDLDLVFNKVLRVEMEPLLKMDHDYTGNESGYEKIITGKYKLRMLILAPKDSTEVNYAKPIDLDEFYTLTAGQADVQVENGYISTPIDLPISFEEQMFYSLKNIALLELTPVDVEVDLKPGYFVGPFVGAKKVGTVESMVKSGMRLKSGNVNIAKTLISKIDKIKHKLLADEVLPNRYKQYIDELKELDETVVTFDHKNLKIVNKKAEMKTYDTEEHFINSNRLKSSVDEVTAFIDRPRQLTQNIVEDLCHLLFNKNVVTMQHMIVSGGMGYNPPVEIKTVGMDYKKCIKDPRKYIAYKELNHVQQITEQPSSISVGTEQLARSVAYFMSKGQMFQEMVGTRRAKFHQHALNMSLGFEWHLPTPMGLFGGFGYQGSHGVRTDIYTVNQDAEILSNLRRNINQVGVRFNTDRFDISFRAKVKSCVMIGAKYVPEKLPERYIQTSLLLKIFTEEPEPVAYSSNKRFYICMNESRDIPREESWYFLKLAETSSMADEHLARNTIANAIRGKNAFEDYRQSQIEDDQKIMIGIKTKNENVMKQYQNYMEKKGNDIQYKDRVGVGFPGLLE